MLKAKILPRGEARGLNSGRGVNFCSQNHISWHAHCYNLVYWSYMVLSACQRQWLPCMSISPGIVSLLHHPGICQQDPAVVFLIIFSYSLPESWHTAARVWPVITQLRTETFREVNSDYRTSTEQSSKLVHSPSHLGSKTIMSISPFLSDIEM